MGAPVVGDGSTNVDLVTSSGPTTRNLKAAMTTNNLWLDGAPLGADSDVRFSTSNTGLVLGSSTVGTINALRQRQMEIPTGSKIQKGKQKDSMTLMGSKIRKD